MLAGKLFKSETCLYVEESPGDKEDVVPQVYGVLWIQVFVENGPLASKLESLLQHSLGLHYDFKV